MKPSKSLQVRSKRQACSLVAMVPLAAMCVPQWTRSVHKVYSGYQRVSLRLFVQLDRLLSVTAGVLKSIKSTAPRSYRVVVE